MGLTEILVDGLHVMAPDNIQKIALDIQVSTSNLYRLLGNLLEWSSMQRGLTSFSQAILLLKPKVDEAVVLIKEAVSKKNIFINNLCPDTIEVYADKNMLGGIFRNIISNAAKFTPKSGTITISAKLTTDNHVEISVNDTGIGMNSTILDNLFNLEINTNRKGIEGEPSTGLGLILCKDFIEKHGGKLWIESEEGKGSTFYFTLPVAGN
jgi:signal transduction histidine kinase